MPSLRLYPLLVAGAACLTLAACGGDDDPPQASAPAQTESAAPTQTTPEPSDNTATSPDATPESTESPSSSSGNQTSRPSTRKGSKASETADIHETLVALQEAFAAKDGEKACSLIVGIPEKAPANSPNISCEALGQGPKMQLSEENRRIAANAKVTIDGNKATAELRPGAPLTLRKVDGRWRVDYSQMGQGPGSR